MSWSTTWEEYLDVSLLPIEDDIFDVGPLQATRILEARTLTTALSTLHTGLQAQERGKNFTGNSGLYGGCSPMRACKAHSCVSHGPRGEVSARQRYREEERA